MLIFSKFKKKKLKMILIFFLMNLFDRFWFFEIWSSKWKCKEGMINKCINFFICFKCMYMILFVFDCYNLILFFFLVLDIGIYIFSIVEILYLKFGDKLIWRYFFFKKIFFRLCMFRNCILLLILVIVCYNVL